MQSVVSDKPYVPVPPHRGWVWPTLLMRCAPLLHRKFGVESIEVVHADRLAASLNAGHGVMLAPNHCRDEDPFVLSALAREVNCLLYMMASSHLFSQSKLQRWFLSRAGAFSVYREGIDRAAVNAAIDILTDAKRPLVIFPEGFIARTNDKLNDLMDGPAMIARTAAKRRAKLSPAGRVVCHPVALRYRFAGDINRVAGGVLDEIESRLSWRPDSSVPVAQRIYRVGLALLSLKEIQYRGVSSVGTIADRLAALIESILAPIEDQWCGCAHDGSVNARVKRLRAALLPDLIEGEISEADRARRWRLLEDVYVANELSHYPQDYVHEGCSAERILETIERFEEDLTDNIRVHGHIRATITVGTAIDVPAGRESRGTVDPMLQQIDSQLRQILGVAGTEGQALERSTGQGASHPPKLESARATPEHP